MRSAFTRASLLRSLVGTLVRSLLGTPSSSTSTSFLCNLGVLGGSSGAIFTMGQSRHNIYYTYILFQMLSREKVGDWEKGKKKIQKPTH